MNYYPNFNNQFYGQPMQSMQPQMQRIQTQEPQYQQFSQPQYKQPIGLQGKSVDSVDVVKAMDIPLDGSISYFPITDGSAIITKQLQQDGTSKTIIYKPIQEEEVKNETKYITEEQLNNAIKKIDLSDIEDLKEELVEIKREIKQIKKFKNKED